jgi:tetratricopeptide (TPR) repeat protein
MKKLLSFLPILFCISISAISQDATTLYQEGVQLKGQKKIKDASEKFKQASQIKPRYTEALYELGWCRNDLKDYSGAIQVLRQVVPVWTTTAKSYFELAYAFEKTTSYDSAIYYYNKCLSVNPEYSGVYKQLGFIAYLQGDDNKKVLDHFVKYENITKNPITDYLYWYRKGFTHNALKDYTAAKTALQKSLEYKTDYLNTYLELGFASSRLKEDDQAIAYYNKAIETDPKSHIAYNGIGEVYRDNKKNMEEAMNWYQKTLKIDPNERKANFGMGYCLNSGSRYNEAISHLKKAIEMEKDYTAAYVELGYSYYKNGNNTDAMTNLKQGISLNPKNENSRYYMGLIYISQKDKTNAQRMVDELKSLNSKNSTSLQASVDKM